VRVVIVARITGIPAERVKEPKMDRYEIGLDVSGKEPAIDFQHCQCWDDAIVRADEMQAHYPKRNVYVFDRMASWRQVQTWHYINGELVPISWRS